MMRRALFAMAAVLPACASTSAVPAFRDTSQLVEARTGRRIFWDQGGAADEAVSRRLRDLLDQDLSVDAAVQIALLHNEDLQAIYEDLSIAQADLVQAGLLRNPTLSGDVTIPIAGSGVTTGFDLGVAQDFVAGVAGLVQPHVAPGETYVYEFTLRQQGTLMYHPHSDEMVQMALGMMGFFIIHPRGGPRVDRDFAIMLHEWAIAPGTSRPNPAVVTDFNIFTFNSRAWPGTDPLVAKKGDRVRVRLANLSMDSHPIHLHGHHFEVTGNDAGPVPPGTVARKV
jgi:hypothetical protein